jgi:hypothetical protein
MQCRGGARGTGGGVAIILDLSDEETRAPGPFWRSHKAPGQSPGFARHALEKHAFFLRQWLTRHHRSTPAAANAASPQQNDIMQEPSPASASGEPLVETASVAQPVSSAAVPPAYLMPLASPPAVTAAESAPSAGTRGPSARNGRSAHAGKVSRHSNPHSARGAPTLTPPRSLLAQTLTPPQTSSSGQTRTRGQIKPADQALTPPRVDQPDPFAPRVWNK